MVARFLDIYAAEFRRPGRADQPAHYREQLERIRRESILAGVLRIESALPARLKVSVSVRGVRSPKRPAKKTKGKKGSKTKKPQVKSKPGLELAIPFLDLFREEFFVALGQAMNWGDEDAREFWRDLDIYRMLSTAKTNRNTRAGSGASGPFVDRVALLLDPSLMEQARRAAAKFQLEINAASDRVLRKVFSRHREN